MQPANIPTTFTDFRFVGDEAVFRAINGLNWPLLDRVFVLASHRTFGWGAFAILCVLVTWKYRGRSLVPLLTLASVVALCDAGGHYLLKPYIARLRPCFALPPGTVRQLVDIAMTGAMPSLHAANAATVAAVSLRLLPQHRLGILGVATLIGVSRVAVGVHWPSDVLGGLLYGGAVAWVLLKVASPWLPAATPSSTPPVESGSQTAALPHDSKTFDGMPKK